MKLFILLLLSTFFLSNSAKADNCVSLGNGDWNASSTWSCGHIPNAGDTITILSGDTVTVSTVINVVGAATSLTISGVLLFDTPGSELRLPCGSVIIITPSGSIQSSGASQSTHAIRICRDDVWGGGTLTGPVVLGVVLPIELVFFEAKYSEGMVSFIWQTVTEKDNDYFTIEGSADGFNWNSMNRVAGAGTTEEVQNYSFVSPNNNNFSYFRLKQTDFDGEFSYSDIVAVTLVHETIQIYPNPSNGRELNINLPSKESGLLQVLSADGRVAYSLEFSSSQELHLNDLYLAPGSYIIQVQQSDEFEVDRLIVR